jgi:hypothetical protein
LIKIDLKHKDFIAAIILFPVAFIPLFISAFRNFAKTDDYVFLGLIKSNKFSVIDGFQYLSMQEWTAGRWISNLLLSIIFHDGTTVADLTYLRLFFIVVFFVVLLVHYFTLRSFHITRSFALICTLGLLAIPGFQSFITLLASGPYLLAILMALLVSRNYVNQEEIVPYKIIGNFFTLILVSCIYQPATFFALMYPAINLILSKFSTKASKRFCYIYLLTNFALLFNWISIKFSLTESRASFSIDIPSKISALFGETWNLAQFPWARFLSLSNQETSFIVLLLLLLNAICVVRILKKSNQKSPNLLKICSTIFILTAGIPFSFPWFFLISESSTDFRRYSFASGLAMEITLVLIFIFMQSFSFKVLLRKSLTLGISVIVILLFILTSLNTLKSSSILEREWEDFVCASAVIKLNADVKIRSNEILIMYQGNRPISEDFNTSSLVFQNPPTFMLWLSQFEAGQQVDFAPWNMNFSYDLVYDGDELGKKWSDTLFACSK